MMQVEVTGVNKSVLRLKALPYQVSDGAISGIDKCVHKLKDLASNNLDMWNRHTNPDSTRTQESINANWIIEGPTVGPTVVATLGNSSPHSIMVEYGTGDRNEQIGGEMITPVTEGGLLTFQ